MDRERRSALVEELVPHGEHVRGLSGIDQSKGLVGESLEEPRRTQGAGVAVGRGASDHGALSPGGGAARIPMFVQVGGARKAFDRRAGIARAA